MNRIHLKQIIFLLCILSITINFSFAKSSKTLDQATIEALKSSFILTPQNQALMNAVSNNDIKSLVLNRDIINHHNDVFNLKLSVKGITNQKSSGRCWMFAGLNIMRPAVKEKYNLESFEFSLAYLFFWDKIEKANFFLEAIIETRQKDIDDRELQTLIARPVPDGGWWNYVVSLIEKYGVVPKKIMPETENSSKSRGMNKTIQTVARHAAVEIRKMARDGVKTARLRAHKIDVLKEIYRLLVLHLGAPPEEFTWQYEDKDEKVTEKKYTPLEFYQEAVGLNLADYVTLFNYPVHPYDQHFQIDYCRNMPEAADMNFINLKIEQLKQYALKSLENNDPVWFAADVGHQMERKQGIMADGIYDYESLFNIPDKMTKAHRVLYRISTPNHAMVFIAADTAAGKVRKWRVENSWGTDRGNKGYWTMYDNWFDEYVFTVIIRKKYLPKKVIALLKTKPTRLPAWDPMREFFK